MSGVKSFFKCELCNMEMTGDDNYRQHMEGKKHLKKVKSLGFDAGTSQIGSQGQTSTAVSSTTENSKPVLPPPPKQIIAGDIIGTSNEDPVMNAVKANLLGKLPLKRVSYERRCDTCGVDYTSRSHEEQHLLGKKHLKKVQALKASEEGNAATLYCGFCNLTLNSIEQMEQHRNGASHKKKVEKAKADQVEHSVAKKRFVRSEEERIESGLIPLSNTTLPPLEPLTYDK
ncbi:hypothetical protein ACF0H5_022465 [Mactra antiquata]